MPRCWTPAPVRALFGLTPDESLLGWVNIGTAAPLGRKKLTAGNPVPAIDDLVVRLDA